MKDVQTVSVFRYGLTLVPVFVFLAMYAFQETTVFEPELKYLKKAGFMVFWIFLADVTGWLIDKYLFKIK
ncbi:MAG: hypothetical protein AB2758_20745 [Candidatus Thiodiazotropha endolucinida]